MFLMEKQVVVVVEEEWREGGMEEERGAYGSCLVG